MHYNTGTIVGIKITQMYHISWYQTHTGPGIMVEIQNTNTRSQKYTIINQVDMKHPNAPQLK